MADTPIAGFPQLTESQSGKYLTVNEMVRLLEAVTVSVAVSSTTSAQPGTPDDGDVYILPAGPLTGAQWALFASDSIAVYVNTGWLELVPNAKTRYEFDVADLTDTWRSWNGTAWFDGRDGVAAAGGGGGSADIRYLTFTLDAAIHHNSVGFQLAVIDSLQFYATSGGTDLALAAVVTPSSTLNGYNAAGLNDGVVATNWANGTAPGTPVVVTVDLGIGNEIAALHSYAITIANDSGNAVYHPTGFHVETGPDTGNYTTVDTRTGETFAALGQKNTYVVT